MTRADINRQEQDDITISAGVLAQELRFEELPVVRVRSSGEVGNPAQDTRRVNLPPEAVSKVTYRDIGISTHITGRLEERPPAIGPPKPASDAGQA